MSVNKYTTANGLQTLANGSRMWVGTKAAYDNAKQAGTMPNDVLVAITDDSQDNNYSTEEVLTGKFWIDGKPIYRKCCVLTSSITIPRSAEWTNLISKSTYGLTDIDNIISSNIFRIAHHGPCNSLSVSRGSGDYIQAHSEYLEWQLDANSVVILEYTKTTD